MKLSEREIKSKVAVPGERAYYVLRTGAKIFADKVQIYDDRVYCNGCLEELSDRDKRFSILAKKNKGKCISCACKAKFIGQPDALELADQLFQRTLLKLIILYRRDVTATGNLPRHEIYIYDPLFETVKLSRVTLSNGNTREKMRCIIERRKY